MRIAVVNRNNFNHTICRTSGQKIVILPKNYIILDTDNEQEINYWTSLKEDIANKIGIKVLTNESDIIALETGRHTQNADSMKYTEVSVVGDSVSPIAKEIAESTKKQLPDDYFYTKEELLQMDKEDLINICNNFNIKYRKNSSVKTLANLILESGVL